jgi:hypothetical protein
VQRFDGCGDVIDHELDLGVWGLSDRCEIKCGNMGCSTSLQGPGI